jgi:hypothetical protein
MRRLTQSRPVAAVAATGLLLLLAGMTSSEALARSLCVGRGPGCFAAIQPAIDAAHDGDVIRVGPATFAGGITIDKSIELVGAGAHATTIRGGGPVVRIERGWSPNQLAVSIRGLTITGGLTHGDGTQARGGGIEVPSGTDGSPGATVTIENAVIADNRVEPTSTLPAGPPCPSGPCPFALALGGGIDNNGTMMLANTIVRDNRAAGVASDADGGGIASSIGALTLIDSTVIGNQAIASIPNGRFSEGGGIFIDSGALTVRGSAVNDNSSQLSSSLPYSLDDGTTIDMNANSGGVHVGDGVPTTTEASAINENTTIANDLHGEPLAFDAGMLVGASQLTMRDSSIDGNTVIANVGSSADVGPSGSALELDGGAVVVQTSISSNSDHVYSSAGAAGATAALAVYDFDGNPQPVMLLNSRISDNHARAFSHTGTATVQGAGIINNSLLELRHVAVTGNTGHIEAPAGSAQGAGIWNGVLLSGPPVQLTLHASVIAHNVLTASLGLTVQGGGLYTTLPVTIDHSPIADNSPDQCIGC